MNLNITTRDGDMYLFVFAPFLTIIQITHIADDDPIQKEWGD